MFPQIRLRRNRTTSWLRDLVAETHLSASHLILPIFITEGNNIKQPIDHMPDVYRLSLDNMLKEAETAASLGISAIALFPQIDLTRKSINADEAFNPDNLVCRAIRLIKKSNINIGIICDIALDPYTSHGHDGIIKDGKIDNDETIRLLANQAVILAKAGADIVAPSDMMDGRVQAIRKALDTAGFSSINILAYSAKYASSFYGPFRSAIGSMQKGIKIDKSSYQMDIRNQREAMREIEQDLHEGADIIMIKPGGFYVDIITKAAEKFNVPIFAYQVSGEYAMIKLASAAGALNFNNCLLESLICLRRAGSSSIITYGAIKAAKLLRGQNE